MTDVGVKSSPILFQTKGATDVKKIKIAQNIAKYLGIFEENMYLEHDDRWGLLIYHPAVATLQCGKWHTHPAEFQLVLCKLKLW